MYVLGYDDQWFSAPPHAPPLPPSSGVGTPCWIPHTSFLASSLLLSSLYLGRLVDTPPYLWFELIVTITTWYFAVWKQITTVDTTQNKYNAGLKQK